MATPAVSYPQVRSEWETISKVAEGFCLARFGDGELKLMYGKGYRREPGGRSLQMELLRVLQEPHPRCLVGIPTMDQDGPKFHSWIRHSDRYAQILRGDVVTYYSAFVTRPDSAPWIDTQDFAALVASTWAGKHAAVICEPGNKILKAVRLSAARSHHVRCPSNEAYSIIDALESSALAFSPDVILMSCGPTASCLANRFAARGVHAIDIGSAGGYLLGLLMM